MHAPKQSSHDAGFTVVELLVVMLIFGVIGGIVTTSVVQGFSSTLHAEARIDALTSMQHTAANVTREIRAANSRGTTSPSAALRVAEPSRIQMDVIRDLGLATDPLAGGMSRIRLTYRLQGTDLVEDRQVWANRTTSTTATPIPPVSTRVIMRDLHIPAGQSLFAHRDGAGVCLTGCDGLTSALTAMQVPGVSEVDVYLRRDLGGARGAIDVRTKVSLRNAS